MVKTMDVRNSSKEPGSFWEAYPGVRGGEQGTAGSFRILCELGERLCEFPAGKTFPRKMIWCRVSGASSLDLPVMAEHYQKRIETSRYLN